MSSRCLHERLVRNPDPILGLVPDVLLLHGSRVAVADRLRDQAHPSSMGRSENMRFSGFRQGSGPRDIAWEPVMWLRVWGAESPRGGRVFRFRTTPEPPFPAPVPAPVDDTGGGRSLAVTYAASDSWSVPVLPAAGAEGARGVR
jgi:hypothetical protein